MALGIDYELFWSLTPNKLIPFIKAYEEIEKRNAKAANFTAWLTGIYVSHSIASVLGENNRYPEKPLSLLEEEADEDERLAKDAELFGAYAAMFNKEYKTE